MKTTNAKLVLILVLLFLYSSFSYAQQKIYWGNEVPENWNGDWPEKYQTACEKAGFAHTATNQDILEYFAMLKWNSENVHIFNMFTSSRGRNCPVLVMSNPRVTSPREAKASGKTVVYLQGGIHPGECDGKEAILMLVRDILFGKKKYLLDKLIIIVCPNFNVDGNETRSVGRGSPKLSGTRRNARGYDLNRNAIKLETANVQGAYQNLFNTWDPIIFHDTHVMGRARHGYVVAHLASNVMAGHPGPRDYLNEKIFPALLNMARENGGIEIHFHAGLLDPA